MFNHILVPLDRSSLAECVFPHVVTMAQTFDAKVTLLSVMDPNDQSEMKPVDPLDWRIRKAETETYLDKWVDRLQQTGIEVRETIREGNAAECITKFARTEAVDLVIMSSHGRSGLSEWTISSVISKVLLRANLSMLIVRAYQTAAETEAKEAGENGRERRQLSGLRYDKILLPLDCSQRAEYTLSAIAPLLNAYDPTILLAHVVRQPELPRQTPPTAEDRRLVEEIVARNRQEAEQYLEQLQSRLSNKTEIHLRSGESVTEGLHDLAEENDVDLIALCAHGYSGHTARPYGSVTTNFITYSDRHLLIVQDLSPQEVEPTEAEEIAQQKKGH